MNEIVDVETIYRQERQRWLREDAPRLSVRELIANSVPYWIVLVAAVLYDLSAPHTASVFDKLTPGWGWIAPVGVEFGLLYRHFVGGTHILQAKLFPGHCAHLKS